MSAKGFGDLSYFSWFPTHKADHRPDVADDRFV